MDDLKKAERRGYSRGYAAGSARKKRAISSTNAEKLRNAFWQRAFLSVLPAAFGANNWTRGGKSITTLGDCIKLASEAADEALKIAQFRL